MRRKIFQYSTLVAVAAALFGCAQEEGMTILDAAAAYETNQSLIEGIRSQYPGPYTEFRRVPARNPADATQEGEALLKRLRTSFPVEFIDFLPLGNTGKDEVDIILKRFSASGKWTTVSLVFSELPIPAPNPGNGIAVFDACDERALAWFEQDRDGVNLSAFCRINENWYAYQKTY